MEKTLISISDICRRIMVKLGVNIRATKSFWVMGDGEEENLIFSLLDYNYKSIEEYAPSFVSMNNETKVFTFCFDGVPYYSDKLPFEDVKRIREAFLKLERNLHKIEMVNFIDE